MKITGPARPALACLALVAAAACIPLMEFREGEDQQRLRRTATEFCDAVLSPDPQQVRGMFVGAVGLKLQALAESGQPIPYLSGDARTGCSAGRTWYLGGSRMYAEVQTPKSSDRLDMWVGDFKGVRPFLSDVIYGRPISVGGKRVKTLNEALDALGANPGPASAVGA
jgi:hypothetical protein